MRLLVFAYYGEAQAFLENIQCKKHQTPFGTYYESSQEYIFISGEGIYETLLSLGSIYTQFLKLPTSIWNFGVACSLSTLHAPFDTVFVRTSYSCQEHEMNFQSFSTNDTDSAVDCISSMKRILSEKDLENLPHFGHIVDRELWAIGMIAKQYKVSFRACKVISDQVGSLDRCLEVIEKAYQYSTCLLKYYQEHAVGVSKNTESLNLAGFKKYWDVVLQVLKIDENILYMTYSQEERRKSLLKRLSVIYNNKLEQLEREVLIAHSTLGLDFLGSIKGINKKQNFSKVLRIIEFCLDPIYSVKLDHYQKISSDLRKVGVGFRFDPSFEKNKYEFILEVKNKKELLDKIEKLKQLDLTNIFS